MTALIQAYVACKVALEALPRLPAAIRTDVEAPVSELCRVVGPALERIQPGSTSLEAS
jgi:hypothetical protein